MIADAGVVFAEAADCTGISHNGLVPSVFSKDSCELICGAASKPHSLFRMSWRAHNQRNCQQKYKSIDTESNPGHTAGFVGFLHIRWELEVIRTAGSFAGSHVDCSVWRKRRKKGRRCCRRRGRQAFGLDWHFHRVSGNRRVVPSRRPAWQAYFRQDRLLRSWCP